MSHRLYEINRATEYAMMRLNEVKRELEYFTKDVKKDLRLSYHECKVCFYFCNGMAGQAFSSYMCGECKLNFEHPNTRVPRLCGQCSEKHQLCRRCGADIKLKVRKKL